MKKSILLFAMVASIAAFAGENLISNLTPGKQAFARWYRSQPNAFVLQSEGVLQVKGLDNADAKKNFKAQYGIKFDKAKLPGTKFVLSAKVKVTKLTGKFSISIREAFGKSAYYHMLPEFSKWKAPTEWQEFSKTFTAQKESKELCLYLQSTAWDPADSVEIKDLKLEVVK